MFTNNLIIKKVFLIALFWLHAKMSVRVIYIARKPLEIEEILMI
jgi:hypothetical protein